MASRPLLLETLRDPSTVTGRVKHNDGFTGVQFSLHHAI
jgi:hypothetical protein